MPKVFISYSHDSKAHSERVLALAIALGENGIAVELDQFHGDEIIDWPEWCNQQTSKEHSDFVLCVCTAEYRDRSEGKVPPDVGKGVIWEAKLLRDDQYDEKGNSRVIPVFLDDEPESSIVRFLRGWTFCRLRDFALSDSGYEHLLRILTKKARVVKNVVGEIPDLPPDPPPSPMSKAVGVPHQIPSPPPDFTGRDDELAQLLAEIGTGGANISGVEGMAGVGKTALALVLAERLASDYPNEQFYFDLRGADPNQQTPRTPSEAMRHVLFGFDPTRTLPDDEDGLRALYLSKLSDRPALLLMDNAANAEQVKPLVPPNGCLLLVTSRQHFVLPGLAPLNINTLREDRARELLLKICSRIADQGDEIAKLCGYLPLALRVAASTLAVRPAMSPETYVTRLAANRLKELSEVDAAIAVSEDLLPDERRELFRALSVFAESFERSGAARVLELVQDAADDELDALVRCSLLQWDSEAKRYRMHDLVRLFADRRLSGDRRVALKLRHACVFFEMLTAADTLYLKHGEKTYEGLSSFDREWENIKAGFAYVSAHATADDKAAYLCAFYPTAGVNCLAIRQSTDERIAWIEAAVSAAQRLGLAALEAAHHSNVGSIFRMRGDLDEAERMHRKSLEISERLGRLEGTPEPYGNLGTIFLMRGDLDEAEKMHRKSLEISERLGQLEGMAGEYNSLAIVFYKRGDLNEAERMFRKALEIDEKLGRLGGMATAYGNLAFIFEARGDLDEAEKLHRKSLEIEKKLGRLEEMSTDYGNLGLIFFKRGDLEEAEKMHRKALEISESLGALETMANQYGNLGNILRRRCDLDEAEKMYRGALEIDEKLGRLEGMATAYANLGAIFKTRGDLDEARRLWIKARDLFTKIGMPHKVDEMQGWLDELPDGDDDGS